MPSKRRISNHRRKHRRKAPPGSPPGTIIVDPAAPRPQITLISYGPEGFEERTLNHVNEIEPLLGKRTVTWVDIAGLGDESALTRAREIFHLHPLALEDVVNLHQRAKVEQYPHYNFFIAHLVKLHEHLDTEQLSIFQGSNFVLTFQEIADKDLDPVKDLIRRGYGPIRGAGADYLAYALLDTVLDYYFPILDAFGEKTEDVEAAVLKDPSPTAANTIRDMKFELLMLRRAVWPLRDALNTFLREPGPLIRPETLPYLRDLYDHAIRIIDLIEIYREIGSSLMEFYLSSVSNRLNEVMRVLTIIATIFIPLGFIAGIYGMNFNPAASPLNMPELNWYLGYPFALGIMFLFTMAQLFFFWRKGWLKSFYQSVERQELRKPIREDSQNKD